MQMPLRSVKMCKAKTFSLGEDFLGNPFECSATVTSLKLPS